MTRTEETNLRALCAAQRIRAELSEIDSLETGIVSTEEMSLVRTEVKEWIRKLQDSVTIRAPRKGKNDAEAVL